MAWTRAEGFFFSYDTFDPAAVVKITSAIDEKGKINLWDYAVYAAGDRGAALFYGIPNARIQAFGGTNYGPQSGSSLHPFATGPWRAPGARMNVFAIESQIDLMAAAAGIDPLEFRLRNISDPRMRQVLQAAADAFGFQGGEVLEQNFYSYRLPRFSALPKIETVLVKNDDVEPQGAGEPAIVPLGGAVANALFDATGKRVYRLPLTAKRVKEALGTKEEADRESHLSTASPALS